jgi:hypothetical protein
VGVGSTVTCWIAMSSLTEAVTGMVVQPNLWVTVPIGCVLIGEQKPCFLAKFFSGMSFTMAYVFYGDKVLSEILSIAIHRAKSSQEEKKSLLINK